MPPADLPFVWSEPFCVRAYEAGPDGRASALRLCDFIQEAAGEQARTFDLEVFDVGDGRLGTWVLSRLRLRLRGRPAFGETVHVATWPSHYDGLRAERDFEVHGPDGRLAWGTSAWFVLDVERRRPVRLPPALMAFGPADRPRALADAAPPPEAPPFIVHRATFGVRRSDLDRIGHANHVRYAEWALEALPDPLPGRLDALDVVFKAEAVRGDRVVSCAGPAPDAAPGVLAHHLTCEADGRTLALARTFWTDPPR